MVNKNATKKLITLAAVGVVCVVGLAVGLGVGLGGSGGAGDEVAAGAATGSSSTSPPSPSPPPPSPSPPPPSPSPPPTSPSPSPPPVTTPRAPPPPSTPHSATPAATCLDRTVDVPDISPFQYQTCSFEIDGQTCWFDIFVPSALQGATGRAAVLDFHGGGIEVMENADGSPRELVGMRSPTNKGWDLPFYAMDTYEAHGGYVLVTPHSSLDGNTKHRWHWQDGDERTDYTFTDTIVQWLVGAKDVDAGLIFAQGHSSGGIFLYSWVAGGPWNAPAHTTETTTWRAVSPSGANMIVGIVELRGKSGLPVPLLCLHGEDDDTQHYQNDPAAPSSRTTAQVSAHFGLAADYWEASEAETIFNHDRVGQYWYPVFDPSTAVSSSVRLWARAAGCNADVAPAVATADSCQKRASYSDCAVPVESRAYVGGGHSLCAAALRLAFYDRFCAGFAHGGCDWGERCDRTAGTPTCVAVDGWDDACSSAVPLSGCPSMISLGQG